MLPGQSNLPRAFGISSALLWILNYFSNGTVDGRVACCSCLRFSIFNSNDGFYNCDMRVAFFLIRIFLILVGWSLPLLLTWCFQTFNDGRSLSLDALSASCLWILFGTMTGSRFWPRRIKKTKQIGLVSLHLTQENICRTLWPEAAR